MRVPRTAPPPADGLRVAGLAVALLHHAASSRLAPAEDLEIYQRAGLAISGFLVVDYLSRERRALIEARSGRVRASDDSWVDGLAKVMPLPYWLVALAAIFFLPASHVLAGLRRLDLPELIEWSDRSIVRLKAGLVALSAEDWCRVAWPWLVLLGPRPLLRPLIAVALGLGLVSEGGRAFAGGHPILSAASSFDLLGLGAILGMLGRWTGGRVVLGICLAGAAVGGAAWGGVGGPSAPTASGLANLALVLVATLLLVADSWTRDHRPDVVPISGASPSGPGGSCPGRPGPRPRRS